ncbi:MAG: gliding motility-associated protein GldE, partial [Bacteroidales bacterium]|nr:gliding motility-associated protein GldE [Bacteroidales bacterium]
DKQKLESQKSHASINILKCLENPEKLLATILILNNTVNIGIVILSTYITSGLLDHQTYPVLSFVVEVVVITFIIVLIGEIMPKIIATRNTFKVLHLMAAPLRFFMFFLNPVIYPLTRSSQIVRKRIQRVGTAISVDDLSNALEITSASLNEERKMLEGIVKFGNIEVCQIMKPRLDIVAINWNDNFSKVLSKVIESGYSRLPVYEDTLDNIKGILIAKDLFPYIGEKAEFHWQGLIKPAYFVPETKKIDDLLTDFQRNKIHLAIVVDEHGGTSGLVTMEDILEEIVGEIEDESDIEEEQLYKKLSPDCWLFEAKISMNDFCKVAQLPNDFFEDISGNYETLAGFILELTGEIPPKGSKINFKTLTFEIENADKKRIRQIKVCLNNKRNEKKVLKRG